MRKAKFEVKDMLTIGLVFVVTGIALAYGLEVTGDIKEDICNTNNYWNSTGQYCQLSSATNTKNESAAYNATVDAIQGVAKIPEKMPLIATVVVAAIIIGIILRYLVFR